MAVDILSIITIVVEFMIIMGLGIWLLIIYNKGKHPLLEPNQNIIVNFNPDESDGHVILLENKKLGENIERQKVSYSCYPLDIYYSDNPDHDQSLKRFEPLQPIHLPQGYREILPKGTFSHYRHIGFYYPTHPENLPSQLKNSKFGQAMQYVSLLQRNENIIEKGMTEGYKNVAELFKLINFGEMSETLRKSYESYIKNFIELKLAEQGAKTQSTQVTGGM